MLLVDRCKLWLDIIWNKERRQNEVRLHCLYALWTTVIVIDSSTLRGNQVSTCISKWSVFSTGNSHVKRRSRNMVISRL